MPTRNQPPTRDRPPTIDMTLEGDVVSPPSFFARAHAIWRALPPGALPALLTAGALLLIGAVFFVGLVIVAVPVLVVLAALALLARALARPR